MEQRIFLLSPASCSGRRAALLLDGAGDFPLARTLRSGGTVSLADAFTFLSGLYFRGKRAYAERFARPPDGAAGALVISSSRGLLPIEMPVTASILREFAATEVDPANPRYIEPLLESARALNCRAGAFLPVLLGSVATDKYIVPLSRVFPDGLSFPAEFVGRGDLSRGGLLLRHARVGRELRYVRADGATRRGARPPRLGPARARRIADERLTRE